MTHHSDVLPLFFFLTLRLKKILKLAVMPDPVDLKVIPGSRTPAFIQELGLSKAESLAKGPPKWGLFIPDDFYVIEG